MNGSIVVIETKRSKQAQKHVAARIAAGQCIACDADPNPHTKRGLCNRCHEAWRRRRATISDSVQKAQFDAELIREGHLLERDEIRAIKRPDVFTTAANKVSEVSR